MKLSNLGFTQIELKEPMLQFKNNISSIYPIDIVKLKPYQSPQQVSLKIGTHDNMEQLDLVGKSLNEILNTNFLEGGTGIYPFSHPNYNFSNVFDTRYSIINNLDTNNNLQFDKLNILDDKLLRNYISESGKANVIILTIPDNFNIRSYNLAKFYAKLNNKRVQFIKQSTLFNWLQREGTGYRSPFLLNIAVQLLAKAGGTPWILDISSGAGYGCTITGPLALNSVVVGISFSSLKDIVFGVSMFINLKNLDQEFNISSFTMPEDFRIKGYYLPKKEMANVVKKAEKWAKSYMKKPSHLFIYKTSPVHEEEILGLSEISTNWAIIHLKTSGTLLRLFDECDINYMVKRGIGLISKRYKINRCQTNLTVGKIFMTTTGRVPRPNKGEYRTLGTPRPIELEIFSNYEVDLQLIANQVLALTKIDWECCLLEKRVPAIIKYSRRMASFARTLFRNNLLDYIEGLPFDARDLI
ncbi:MAG: hypothetical protein QXS29_06145 [Nitrososphaeria archaeon]